MENLSELSSSSSLINEQLYKNIESFLNEMELCFPYIDKNIIPSCKEYIKNIKEDANDFNEFIEYTVNHIKIYEKEVSFILFSKKKVKTEQYNFLNNIKLFGKENRIIHFNIFEKENKNTKKNLIRYIYNIYMSCTFLSNINKFQDKDENIENKLSDELKTFIERIQNEVKEQEEKQIIDKQSMTKNYRRTNQGNWNQSNQSNQRNQSNQSLGNESIQNLMGNLVQNKEIFNIATDIAQQMNNEKINPMSLLSSLMSGNLESNSSLQNLVSQIQNKVEEKINNGDINKEDLENQSKNIMESIQGANIPELSSILKNMPK